MDRLLSVASSPVEVLEVGCGRGDLWWKNADRIPSGWAITLTDISKGMVAEALQNAAKAGMRGVQSGAVNVEQMPYRDNSFDVVIANHMLYHVPDRQKALAEVRRVLKPEGVFIAATNGKKHLLELFQFASQAASEYMAVRESTDENFSLENGRVQLEAFYRDVRLERYVSELRVDDVQPIVDFLLSSLMFKEELPKAAAAKLTRLVEQEMVNQNGVIRIQKDVGLFVASGAQL